MANTNARGNLSHMGRRQPYRFNLTLRGWNKSAAHSCTISIAAVVKAYLAIALLFLANFVWVSCCA